MSTLSARAVLGVNAPISQSFTLDKTLLNDGFGDRDFALGLLGPSPPVLFEETSSVPPFNLELGLFLRFVVFTFPPRIVGRPAPAKLLVVSPPPYVSFGTCKLIDMLLCVRLFALAGQLYYM